MKILSQFDHNKSSSTSRCYCVHWKYDGRLFASAGEDKAVRIWLFDLETKQVTPYTQIVGDQIRTIRCICFSPCGNYLATASFDSTAIVYKYEDDSFDELHRLEGHENEVKSIAYSASGQYLATSSRDKSVFIWQFDEDEDAEVDAIMQQHSGDVKFVAWHPNDDFLVSGGYDCGLIFYRYDGSDWQVHQHYKEAHEETIWCARFNAAGDYLVSVSGDSCIKLWKRSRAATLGDTRWTCVATERVADAQWPIYTVAWDPLEDSFVIGGGDRTIWSYKLERDSDTLVRVDSLEMSLDVNCIAFNPKAWDIFAAAFDEGQLAIGQLEE